VARYLRRTAFYRLYPPAVSDAAPTAFQAPPVNINLAPAPIRRRSQTLRLAPPTVIDSAVVVYRGPRKLAPHPRQARGTHYVLRPPPTLATTATFVARAIQTRLVSSHRATPITTSLSPPAVVDSAVVVYRSSRKLAPQPRQACATHYILRAPATLAAAAVPFVARAVQTRFAVPVRRAKEQHFTSSTLFPPEIIEPLPETGPSMRKLARTPRQARVTRSTLRAPAVVGVVTVTPPFRPIQVSFATAVTRAAQRKLNSSRLCKPAAVGSAIIFRPLSLHYRTATIRVSQKRNYSSKLQPPAVVTQPSGDNPSGGVFDPIFFLLIDPEEGRCLESYLSSSLPRRSSPRAQQVPAM
jgi:hypothetical protein